MGRKNKISDLVDGDEKQKIMIFREELNWTAHEAEIANLRSELLLRRLMHLEEDMIKIKESIKAALEVSIQINVRLEGLEKRLNADKGRRQMGSSEHIKMALPNNDVSKISYMESKVIDLLNNNGPMSAGEIREKIGRSREHVSRVLGKLVDREILIRNKNGRKVIYEKRRSGPNEVTKIESSPIMETSIDDSIAPP